MAILCNMDYLGVRSEKGRLYLYGHVGTFPPVMTETIGFILGTSSSTLRHHHILNTD